MKDFTMSRKSLIAFACVIGMAAASLQAAPIWEFKFDETGTTATNTGTDANASNAYLQMKRHEYYAASDLHGAAGSGVSGQATDRALDMSGLTAHQGYFNDGNGTNPPVVSTSIANSGPILGLTTATWSGWFKAAETIPTNAYGTNISLTGSNAAYNAGGWFIGFRNTDGNLSILAKIEDPSGEAQEFFNITGQVSPTDTSTWHFWALTYDGTQASNNLKLYMGTDSNAVAQVGAARTVNFGQLGTTAGTDFNVAGYSAFKGYLDNVRIDGEVLSLSALDTRRSTDAAVPEPASLSLLALAAPLLLKRRRKQA